MRCGAPREPPASGARLSKGPRLGDEQGAAANSVRAAVQSERLHRNLHRQPVNAGVSFIYFTLGELYLNFASFVKQISRVQV